MIDNASTSFIQTLKNCHFGNEAKVFAEIEDGVIIMGGRFLQTIDFKTSLIKSNLKIQFH
jgi:hypothetical protein